jgi:activator of Hsp90 ATPase-like protein
MTELTTESTVYVTYIAASPEQVWAALTSSEFTTQYFFGRSVESDWKTGSPWILRMPDGRIDVRGEVRESDPPRKLVVSGEVLLELIENIGPELAIVDRRLERNEAAGIDRHL